jgi:hypothetical protein
VTTLATVAELADHLQTTIVPDSASAMLALEGATQVCQDFTGQHLFYVADEEITIRANGQDTLLLPQVPVVDVSLVDFEDEELVPEDDYFVTSAGLLKRVDAVWTDGSWVNVTYSHGWETIPASLRLACLIEAGALYQGHGDASDKRSETIDDYSYTRFEGGTTGTRVISARSATLLASYAQHRLA